MTLDTLDEKYRDVDIVLLLDTAISMQPLIGALQRDIGVLIEHLTKHGKNSRTVRDWRIKACGYGNAIRDGATWWQEMPFCSDILQVGTDLASLAAAKGGNNEARSLLDGLWKVAELPAAVRGELATGDMWRHHHDARRCVLTFTDASCLMVTSIPEAGEAVFDDVASKVMAARLRLILHAPQSDCYEMVGSINRCEWVVAGSLSDTTAKMAYSSANTAKFRSTLEQLADYVVLHTYGPAMWHGNLVAL